MEGRHCIPFARHIVPFLSAVIVTAFYIDHYLEIPKFSVLIQVGYRINPKYFNGAFGPVTQLACAVFSHFFFPLTLRISGSWWTSLLVIMI